MKKPSQLEPASAKNVTQDKINDLFDDHQWYAEPKLDGWRFLMHFGGGLPRTFLTGRRISKHTGEYSEKGARAPGFMSTKSPLGYTVLDGEIMPPEGASFSDLAGIMNVSPEKAAARIKEIGHPTYVVFDCLFYNGTDLRERPILSPVDAYRPNKTPSRREYAYKCMMLLDHARLTRMASGPAKRKLYDQIIEDGGEGIILKDSTATYGNGWVKVKRVHTLDVVVMDATDAKEGKTGKFKGLIGALVVGVYRGGKLVEVGQVSGMTDEERYYFTSKGIAHLRGEVIEIKAQEMAKERLRHPRYSRMRPDVSPSKCTWSKMMHDLEAQKGKR